MSNDFQDPKLFRSLLENLPVGVYVVDTEQRIRFWNRGAEHLTGYLSHEMVGRNEVGDLLKPCDRQGRPLSDEHSPIQSTLRNGIPQQFVALYLHKNGHRLSVRVRVRPIFEHGDVIVGAITLFEEAFSFREDALGALMYGCLDAPTGVPSRRLTRAVLLECLRGAEETRIGFGLVQARIMGLSEFSSKHGPQSMLPFLRATAQTLRHNLEAESFLGRWSEDEFLAILPSGSPMVVSATAERIRHLLNQSEVSWWGDHFQIQAEIQNRVVRPGETLESLLGKVDVQCSGEEAKGAAASSSGPARE